MCVREREVRGKREKENECFVSDYIIEFVYVK